MKPKTWNDISVAQFIKIYDLYQDESLDNIDRQVRLLSNVTGKTIDEIEDLSILDFKLLSIKHDYLHHLPEEKPAKDFKAGGYYWKIQKDVTKLTTAEYINLSELLKEKENVIVNLPSILSIFCVPHNKFLWFKWPAKLEPEKIKELLSNASIAPMYSMALFFCRLLIHLTVSMKDSLEIRIREMMQTQSQQSQTHTTTGVGI